MFLGAGESGSLFSSNRGNETMKRHSKIPFFLEARHNMNNSHPVQLTASSTNRKKKYTHFVV